LFLADHNQNCTFEEECAHISKLVCLGDRCVCEEGHFLSPDEKSCLSREYNQPRKVESYSAVLKLVEEKTRVLILKALN